MDKHCTVRNEPDCRQLAKQLLNTVALRGMNRDRVRAAILLADAIHLDHRRKTGEAHLIRLLLVSMLVLDLGGREDDVIAALLHDSQEFNSPVSFTDIHMAWGPAVSRRVAALTRNHTLAPEFRLFDSHGRLLQAMPRLGFGLGAIKVLVHCHISACSESFSEQARQQLQDDNQRFMAPLAHQIGARGLAQFLRADPGRWWQTRDDFPGSIRALQGPFLK